jgi:hypothetical protein
MKLNFSGSGEGNSIGDNDIGAIEAALEAFS